MTAVMQRSLEWYRARLGKITGSKVGVIMGKGKGTEFSKTGMSYMATVAGERMLPAEVVESDYMFGIYLDEIESTSKAMRIGSEREEEARGLYEEVYGVRVKETGCTESERVKGFASSPDGILIDGDGAIEGTIEIKCPKPSTYMEYLTEVKDGESLLKVNAEYYWQCMSHMEVTGAEWCDFVVYCPYNVRPLHVVRIRRDEESLNKLRERLVDALKYIGSLTGEAEGRVE